MLTPDLLRAAFRDLHARRLHGFALLLALGDRDLASSAAATALDEAGKRIGELRHPERAAAWLRRRVLALTRDSPRRRGAPGESERRQVLRAIGVHQTAYAALAALRPEERALLVAERVEGLAPLDAASIVGVGGRRLARLRSRSWLRYTNAFRAAHAAADARSEGSARAGIGLDEGQATDAEGPISTRVQESAGSGWM